MSLNHQICIVLRWIDSLHCLIIPCDNRNTKNHLLLDAKRDGEPIQLSVNVIPIYSINTCFLYETNISLLDPQQAVCKIYEKRNSIIKRRKNKYMERKEAKAKKSELQRIKRIEYEKAVLNNDRQAMKEIEEICGGDPRLHGRSKEKNTRAASFYVSFVQGGSCSHK